MTRPDAIARRAARVIVLDAADRVPFAPPPHGDDERRPRVRSDDPIHREVPLLLEGPDRGIRRRAGEPWGLLHLAADVRGNKGGRRADGQPRNVSRLPD